ncbi:hypothetical protein [Helicobacter sp. MIT 05-5294]|uniref:hypothetical protein n=1 Tax=Helicobacter sp. MIT 05-5294 TaxID=1548150 RepID=UPI001EE79772|nr:hypothetical protein [Helicobacter sp. MIT 05-5294]
MRRNSTNQKNIKYFFLVVALIVYVALTDIFYFLPPLLGVMYVLAQENYEEHSVEVFYFLVPFFLYFEASKGLPFLSLILFMAVSFEVVLPKFRKFFGSSKIFIPLFIVYAYLGYFAFLEIFGLFLEVDMPQISWLMGWYIACEIILVWFFMWILL